MPIMRFRFPGGRYHATPYGHHVNEGQIEWPPSPWRILRALIATGYGKLDWRGEVPDTGRRLIESMAEVLPSYHLPSATGAHSRHYMPTRKDETTLVLDTWADLGKAPITVKWDCEIDDECLGLLGSLIENLAYLGRSESWVIGELIDNEEIEPNARPCSEGDSLEPDREQIAVMAPMNPSVYAAWRSEKTRPIEDEYPFPEGKKATTVFLKKRAKALEPYPEDLLTCLQTDTAWWKSHRWSQAPGSRMVLYWRPSAAVEVAKPQHIVRHREKVSLILVSLATPSGNKSALPPVSRTLPQAELLHAAIISRASKDIVHPNADEPWKHELTGCDLSGNPSTLQHRHLHIMPIDLDCDKRIDHVIFYAPGSLSMDSQAILKRLRRTWTKGGGREGLRLAVVGSGKPGDLKFLGAGLAAQAKRMMSEGASYWVSETPFIPPRYIKKSGKNSLEGQVNAELDVRGYPSASVSLLPRDNERFKRFRPFVRSRTRGGVPPPRAIGFALALRFKEPVSGPLILGYGSHFGMGLFACLDGEDISLG